MFISFLTLHKSEKGTFGYDTANDDLWRFDWPLRPVVRACTIVIVLLLSLPKRGPVPRFLHFWRCADLHLPIHHHDYRNSYGSNYAP